MISATDLGWLSIVKYIYRPSNIWEANVTLLSNNLCATNVLQGILIPLAQRFRDDGFCHWKERKERIEKINYITIGGRLDKENQNLKWGTIILRWDHLRGSVYVFDSFIPWAGKERRVSSSFWHVVVGHSAENRELILYNHCCR